MMYLQLFLEFFKTGLFAIGGGMATIPFLYEISDKTGWFTYQDLANMIAVSESTPGPIGVNMATYVGYVSGFADGGILMGLLGAVIASLGLITPSVIVILIVAAVLKQFRNSKIVNRAFYGLRPASTGLITAAALTVTLNTLVFPNGTEAGFVPADVNFIGIALGVVLWVLTNKVKKTKGWHPIVFIGISAVIGILLGM